MLDGSREFEIAWGVTSSLICFSVGGAALWSWVVLWRRGGTSIFGAALDPQRRLQLAWGVFAMFMGGTNAGCRFVPHRYLEGVHEGFFALTLLVIAVLGVPLVRAFLARTTVARGMQNAPTLR